MAGIKNYLQEKFVYICLTLPVNSNLSLCYVKRISIEKFTNTRLKKSWVHDSVGKNGKRLREENSIEA